MNKKVNLYLNITGFASFVLSFLLIFISLKLEASTGIGFYLVRMLLFILGMVSGLLFIGIELLLFMILNIKMKLFLIVYTLLDIVIALYVNNTEPYSFVLVFIGFRIIKDLTRIQLVDKIYLDKKFKEYCKLYGIKLPKETKKKTTTISKSKKKTVVAIPTKKETKKKTVEA